jgi:hypothetical protein
MVTWGELDEVNNCLAQVLALPDVDMANGTITSCVTDNGDGTYSFTLDGKSYVAIPDNTSTKISEEFPGYILKGTNTRCYVREVMPTPTITSSGNVIWENNGLSIRPGGYPTWFSEKFSHQQGSAFPLTTSYIMLRMGEVVLNRAEANAHLGNDAAALADVNAVRSRAGLEGEALMTLTNMKARGYETALDAVLDERRMELYYEGFRVLDLVRNNKDIDRRYPSRAEATVISYDDPRIQYQIPIDESSITGIAKNER